MFDTVNNGNGYYCDKHTQSWPAVWFARDKAVHMFRLSLQLKVHLVY